MKKVESYDRFFCPDIDSGTAQRRRVRRGHRRLQKREILEQCEYYESDCNVLDQN